MVRRIFSFCVLAAVLTAAAGCKAFDETSAEDSGVDAGSEAASGGDGRSAEGWSWEGDTNEQWTISNMDGTTPVDCCGCSPCQACADNTALGMAGPGVTFFTSGPAINGGAKHRTDGFVAMRRGVPVVAGLARTLHIDIRDLSAVATGSFGSEPDQTPTMKLSIREGTKEIGAYMQVFASNGCSSCTAAPTELGDHLVQFTPSGSTVDLVLTATHHSSQCASEISGVRVEIDYVRVRSN